MAINPDGGYSVAVPSGWSPVKRGSAVVLTSPDRAVTVALSADRSDEALMTQPEAIAQAAIASLDGVKGAKAGRASRFRDRYPAVEANGIATRTSDGLRQRLQAFVLKREGYAVFSLLASSAAKSRSPFAKQIDAIVRSVRGRPVTVPG